MSWLSESDRVDAEKREAVMNEGSRKREEITGPPLRMNSTFKTKTHDIHIREMLGAGAYGKVSLSFFYFQISPTITVINLYF